MYKPAKLGPALVTGVRHCIMQRLTYEWSFRGIYNLNRIQLALTLSVILTSCMVNRAVPSRGEGEVFPENINLLKEGNILFNDALSTFYLRLYGIGHMVKDHSDGNPLPSHGLLFLISSKGSFICTVPQTDSLCYTSRGALAGTKNSSMGSP